MFMVMPAPHEIEVEDHEPLQLGGGSRHRREDRPPWSGA
jgi:hypothetical protein